MNRTKRMIAMLLALVLCIGVLAGCETKPAETTAATTKPAGTTAATTAPAATTEATEPAPLTNAERYPIDFDGTLKVVTETKDGDKKFNWLRWEEWTGVDVEWNVSAAEQTPLLFIDDSQLPDIFFNTSSLTIAQINEYGRGGLLINLKDYLDQMPNLSARYAENPGLFDSVTDAEGNFYTLPYYCNTLTMPDNTFYIRTDMTKAAGIEELPTTIEGFLEMCATLKEYYKDVEGFEPMVGNSGKYLQYNNAYAKFFFPAFGELMSPILNTNGDFTEIVAGFATEQFKDYLTFMHTMYAEGYLDDECFVADAPTTKARINAKTAMMHPNPSLTAADFADGVLDYQLYPALSSEAQPEARWALPNNNRTGKYMITTKCADIEAALAFLDALYSVEEDPINDEGTVWGISLWLGELGVDLEVDKEAGTYTILPHEGFDSASTWLSNAGSNSAAYLEWPYVENTGSTNTVKASGVRDMLRADGVAIFYLDWLKLTQEEQEIYIDCWTDIETKIHEMNAAFITGQADIEAEFDNYVQALYEMGLQDVIDVYQAALDRYNAG